MWSCDSRALRPDSSSVMCSLGASAAPWWKATFVALSTCICSSPACRRSCLSSCVDSDEFSEISRGVSARIILPPGVVGGCLQSGVCGFIVSGLGRPRFEDVTCSEAERCEHLARVADAAVASVSVRLRLWQREREDSRLAQRELEGVEGMLP